MSSGQSSRTEPTTISVYALDGKGQVLYDPEHLEVLGKNMCFFSTGWWGGAERDSGQCFLFKNHSPWYQERSIIFS